MYLLDTNALSELRKIPKGTANPDFENWFQTVKLNELFINTIVLLEQRQWVLSKKHRKDTIQAKILEEWLHNVLLSFDCRILPINNDIGLKCAELHIPNPRPQFDSLIAATAIVHNLTLVTRNTKDFKSIEVLSIINTFNY